jgi:hypothetical protein
VLLDGNIGIGGDPERLLRRLGELLRPGGVLVAEVEEVGGCRSVAVRLDADGTLGPSFPWATVGAAAWPELARRAGLVAGSAVRVGKRRFGVARRP